jgi:hypothetical protein
MRSTKRTLLLVASGLAIVSLVIGGFFAVHGSTQAASGKSNATVRLTRAGTASMSAGHGKSTKGDTTNEFRPAAPDEEVPQSSTIHHVSASHVPNPSGNAVTSTNPGFTGFNGLSHADQRNAGTGAYTGTQFSLEPPDQALCVGNSYVLESINTAIQVFTPSGGAVTAPIAINQFLGLAPEIDRVNVVFGDFTSDPKCYFDADTGRWFLTVLQADVDPANGAFTGRTHVEIAVSKTSNPAGDWYIYSLDTTNDGQNGTPNHASCPCLGDQPLIGADHYGFYISTNEFPLFSNGFNGAQLYAMSKTALAAGTLPAVAYFDAGSMTAPDGGIWYSVQPATSPGTSYSTANGGTEYFMSALDFSNSLDSRVAVWAMTNTSSLSGTPAISLTNTVIDSEVYGLPPAAQQKSGPTPYGDSVHSPLALLDGGDDRMEQTVYAAGNLWAGLNTVVQTPNGPTRVGIAYFIVKPSVSNDQVGASMVGQGYVSANQANVLYPSIGVNTSGKAVMTFTLVGRDYYPSAAYASIDPTSGAGDIHIAGAGALPEDGFSGYKEPGFGGTSRWGDYSAAVADSDGTIWLAVEYIPDVPRTLFANWGTYVSHVTP